MNKRKQLNRTKYTGFEQVISQADKYKQSLTFKKFSNLTKNQINAIKLNNKISYFTHEIRKN